MYCVFTLVVNLVLSAVGGVICHRLILEYIPIFIQRKMFGNDQCKVSNAPVPEPMGMIVAAVYLIVMFVFIPFPFMQWIGTESIFPHTKFMAFLSGLISICTAILLGFCDDMLDLRWRHKLLFPTLSSLPVLMVYYVSGNSTTVIIPSIIRELIIVLLPNSITVPAGLNISVLYYIFMGMVIVFCTNAINILAGINGLESGQAVVISFTVIVFNIIQLFRLEEESWEHLLSLYFLIPFFICTLVLYNFNKCPAKVFVGDTFCYWAGMTLAVVSILGHFSKTMILLLIPQVANFLYSIPQLFHLVPCPRHRLPKFCCDTDTVGMSMAEFKADDLSPLGKLALHVFKFFGCLHQREFDKDGERWVEINNLTILNLCLYWFGHMHERSLTRLLLGIQLLCAVFAFFVRFYLASVFYDVVH